MANFDQIKVCAAEKLNMVNQLTINWNIQSRSYEHIVLQKNFKINYYIILEGDYEIIPQAFLNSSV